MRPPLAVALHPARVFVCGVLGLHARWTELWPGHQRKGRGVLGAEVVKGVPQISQFATVKVDQIVNVDSPDITTENWLTIANRLSAIFADPTIADVVVTHGTSTLEETA